MKRKSTEKESILTNELFTYKLKGLYNTNLELFKELQDVLELPIYINDRKTFNYIYLNKQTQQLGDEVAQLSLTKKHNDLAKFSNPVLFEASKMQALKFSKLNDADLVCKIPQEMFCLGEMTFFISQKIFLDHQSALNLITFPKDYGIIGNIIQEVIPNYAKEIQSWQRFQSLTKQERRIIKLLANGCTNSQIGDHLFITLDTVKTHRKNIYKKMDIHSLRDLIHLSLVLDFFKF